jgi:dTDP-4-amino-4,6-dideoxygalactose transaminase
MIPPFVAKFSDEEIDATCGAMAEILRSGQLILGPYTEAFESSLADLAGVDHAVAVNSGSTALEIIFRALDVRDRTILIPTNTNFATAASAIYAGARVELYDNGLYPDLADIESKLTSEVAAVVIVHVGGYIWPGIGDLAAVCRSASATLIEDAAHAHGSTLAGRRAGGLGKAAAFSFYPTKVVTTGEGGMLTTNDNELAERARRYRDQGKSADGVEHVTMGNSWRMTEFGAALGMSQIAAIDRDIRGRRAVIDRYAAELAGPALTFPDIGIGSQVSGHKCIATLAPSVDRHALRKHLAAAGVALGRGVYEVPLHRQPVFADLNQGNFAVADDFARRHICLPLWRQMSDSTVGQVIEAMNNGLSATQR